MRVVIFSWRGPGHPNEGGAEIVTHEHAKAWVKAGHEVTLFTSYYRGSRKEELLDGVKIIRRGNAFIGVRLEAFQWYMGLRQKPDLVIDQFHGIPFFTPLFVKGKKLGFIHEVAQKIWALNPWPWPFNKIAGFFGKTVEPWIFKLFYTGIPFMTVSKSTKADLKAWGVKNITVIPNGVLLPKVLPKVPREKDYTLIYLSALAKDKGVEDAIAIFNIIQRQLPDTKFWIVGKSYPQYIKYLQNLCPQAKFWGYVSDTKKFELLARAHLLVFPSVHEGWGLVIIEAGSVGTPTVAYKVSGIKDAIVHGRTGLMTDNQTPASLANLILESNKNKRLYSKLSRDAKKWSQKFSWIESIEKSTSLISRI